MLLLIALSFFTQLLPPAAATHDCPCGAACLCPEACRCCHLPPKTAE